MKNKIAKNYLKIKRFGTNKWVFFNLLFVVYFSKRQRSHHKTAREH